MAFTMWQVENNLEHFLRSCVVTLRISSNLICRHQKTNISYYSVLIMIGVDGDKRQQQPLKSCQVIPFASSTVAKELLAFWAGFTRLLLLDNGFTSMLKKHNDFFCLFVSRVGVGTGACPGSPFAWWIKSVFVEFPQKFTVRWYAYKIYR